MADNQVLLLNEVKKMQQFFFLRKNEVIKYLRKNHGKIKHELLSHYDWK